MRDIKLKPTHLLQKPRKLPQLHTHHFWNNFGKNGRFAALKIYQSSGMSISYASWSYKICCAAVPHFLYCTTKMINNTHTVTRIEMVYPITVCQYCYKVLYSTYVFYYLYTGAAAATPTTRTQTHQPYVRASSSCCDR